MKHKLAIIIVNYRTAEMLIDCLSRMVDSLDFTDVKIVIVDNYSQDDSVKTIKTWIAAQDLAEHINLLESGTNGGFSAGNNLGIQSIQAENYLLLNSDAYIQQESISKLLNELSGDPALGMVSPRLQWPDGSPQESTFRYHHPLSELIDQAKTGIVTKLFNRYIIALPVATEPRYVNWTSFACIMISSKVIEQLGKLDEGYFMYFEDVQYCWRANSAGFKIKHIPTAEAVHLRGGSSPVKSNIKNRKRLPNYFYQSRTRYYYQKFGYLGLTLANLFWYAGRAISLIRQLLGNQSKAAIPHQWRDIWLNYSSPLGEYTHPGKS